MRGRATASGAAAALAALLAGTPCGAFLPPPYGGRAAAPLADAALVLDPPRAQRESELQLAALLYDGLYRIDSGRPVPHLVEPQPQVSADGRTWTFRLRRDLSLHNGKSLTAPQVAASLERARRSAEAGYLLGPMIRAVAEGDATLVLRLRQRTDDLPWLLAAPATAVAVREGGALLGTGPFRLLSQRAEEVKLAAHKSCFAGRPYLDALTFRLFSRASAEVSSFQVGRLQLSLHGTALFGRKPRQPFDELETPRTTTLFIATGKRRSYLSDGTFKQALLSAVDRERIGRLSGSGRSEVAAGPLPRALLDDRSKPPAHDREEASRLLNRLARRNPELRQDAAQGRIKLSLLIDASRLDDRNVAGALVADLDQVGISIAIEARPAAEYERLLAARSHDLALIRRAVQVPLPRAALAGALAVAGEAKRAASCVRSRRCGRAAARRFMARLPLIPLVHAAQRVSYDARLGGLRSDASGRLLFQEIFWSRGP